MLAKKTKILTIIFSIVLAFSFGACSKADNTNTPNEEVTSSLQRLKGKVVYNIKQGDVPDLTFRYLLKTADIEYDFGDAPIEGKVALAYVENAASLAGLLDTGKADYIIAGEPSISNILKTVSGSVQALDLQKKYYDLAKENAVGSGYPQAVIVVKDSVLQSAGGTVSAIVNYIKNNFAVTITPDLTEALKKADSTVAASATQDAVNRSGLCYYSAVDNITAFNSYFNALKGVTQGLEPDPIGGVPTNDFYFSGQFNSQIATKAIEIVAPDGAPALSLANLISSGIPGGILANVKIVAPTTIGARFNSADMAVLPSIAAAKLFNKNANFKVVSIVTNGNLYMLTK